MLVIATLLGTLALSAAAQPASGAATGQLMVEKSPGKATVAQTRKVTATVEAIDVAQRQVTLKGPGGHVLPLTVGPEVRNLEQVKVGDKVVVAYVEALSLTLKKDGKELRSATAASDSARAPVGDKPGGAVGEQVKVVADVTAVNRKTGMVSLHGPKQTVDLHVEDPEVLKQIKVGDQVEAVYTQALALSVTAATAKK